MNFNFGSEDEIKELTYAQVSVLTNWRVVSTWFIIYIQFPDIEDR